MCSILVLFDVHMTVLIHGIHLLRQTFTFSIQIYKFIYNEVKFIFFRTKRNSKCILSKDMLFSIFVLGRKSYHRNIIKNVNELLNVLFKCTTPTNCLR